MSRVNCLRCDSLECTKVQQCLQSLQRFGSDCHDSEPINPDCMSWLTSVCEDEQCQKTHVGKIRLCSSCQCSYSQHVRSPRCDSPHYRSMKPHPQLLQKWC